VGRELQCGPQSEKYVHPYIKHYFKVNGNGSTINHTIELFE